MQHEDTEEGHVKHDINHLKSNSKPTTPIDIALRRNSTDMSCKKLSNLGQYQDQASIASNKYPNLNLNISLRLKSLNAQNSPKSKLNKVAPFSIKDPINANLSKQRVN